MIPIRVLPVAILSLVVGIAPLYAQQATDTPPPDSKETPKSQEQQAEKKAAAPAPATRPPAANNDSPFDYRSSEKISEDLSVSFPVDI